MQYMLSVPKVRKVHNLRGNPQNHYYPMEELDRFFSKIWTGLRKENKELFPTENAIRDSAIFKASPLHKLTEEQLKASTGYVVDTLEAAIWCFLNTDSYKDCVLKAVNLGDDTDTVGVVAGGLAGLYYGITEIPAEWIELLPKKEWIIELTKKMKRS